MDYTHQQPPYESAGSPNLQQGMPPPQTQAGTTGRGRGRRAYAAQQYDFNATSPAAPLIPTYDQQQPQPGYAVPYAQQPVQAQPVSPTVQYGQPAQPGYQDGQQFYQQPLYPQQPPYQGQQPNVGVLGNQFSNMHVSTVSSSRCFAHRSLPTR